jgi:hypothetical protein
MRRTAPTRHMSAVFRRCRLADLDVVTLHFVA